MRELTARLCDHGRFIWALVLALPQLVLAQPSNVANAIAQGAVPSTVRIVRTATPPTIDGSLDDAVWASAGYIENLHQVNPTEYAEPSGRTEIYLLYDDDALYVAARVHTPPGELTANTLRQNSSIGEDDALYIHVDPFNTRRGGYFFGLNANAVRWDGIYRNVSEFYYDWDGIWHAETQRFEGGWTAEYAIPFKSLSFDPNSDTWGFNVSRKLQSRNEDMAWVSRNRRWDPSSAGLITGFSGLSQGLGLDIVPSASLSRRRRLEVAGTDVADTELEPSLDVFYKITPQLNASLTINTDFSATEVDDRQVNLTRFGLFFPEKRDFFLRESDIFEFGRIGASDGNGDVSAAERQNARPFFSRRIGLGPTGEVVDLKYGGKVSGRVGRFELGALSIRQDATADIAADTLSVVRAKAGIGSESSVGMVFTNGDPLSNLDNSVAGIDALYRNGRLPGGRVVEAGAWYQESDTEGDTGDANGAAGVTFSMPSENKFGGGIAARRVEENFNPALGFISRTDVRDYSGHIQYTHRPAGGYWQSLFFKLDAQRIENLDGGLQTQSFGLTPFRITNQQGDFIFWRSNFEKDVLDLPFEVWPGIVIPAGEYSFSDHGIEYSWAQYRRISGRIARVWGEFYGGHKIRTFGQFNWKPSPRFRTTVNFNIQDIDLPEGVFTTRIVSTQFDVVFSSRLSWTNLIQYDNFSENMGFNIRLNWIPEAGREMFFVINHNIKELHDFDGRFHSTTSDVVAKVSYTLRF